MFHVERMAWGLLGLALATASGAEETVTFPGAGIELRAVVHRPPGPGPFPAVLLLHGCGGLWARNGEPTASHLYWARHLRDRGFVTVLLDSFGPRGEKEICTQQVRAVRPDRERVEDAWAALRWLVADSSVDPGRVSLLGWSNGGTTVLNAVLRRPPKDGPSFRAGVAFYPGCGVLAKRDYRPHAPVLIQAGAADDWTPASDCEALARAAGGPHAVEIDVYDGAHHAFDRVDGRVRFRADVRNLASPNGRGATVGPHPKARQQALQRTTAYLEAAGKPVPRGTTPADGGRLP